MKNMIRLVVDDKDIEIEEGKNLLNGCLDNGIYIPNLCFMKEMENPPASCRLCFVEVGKEGKPVPACKVQPKEGMVVRTDTEEVRRLQRTALRLLLSVHKADCRNCPSNKRCELQRMVRLLGVRLRPRRFDHIDLEVKPGDAHPLFTFLPSRCVLCGKCVYVCRKRNGYSMLTFAKRGFDTVVSSYGETDPSALHCGKCRACIEICPVSAIFLNEVPQESLTSLGYKE